MSPQSPDALIAHVSHEMRTPLHAILAATELVLADDGLADNHRRHLRLVMIEAMSLTELVNNLLDSARLAADRFALVNVPFAPSAMIDEVAQAIAVSADDKGLAVAVDIDPAVPRVVVGDGERIRRVIINLAWNAVKYTDRGRVTLRMVRLVGDRTRFEVVDTGRGIPPEVADRLFKPFEQVSAEDQTQGFGLGLSLVRRIVDELDGRIEFESGPSGTTFRFDVDLPVGHLPSASTGAAVVGGQGRILVVDDGPVNRTLAESQLLKLGYEPVVVDNATAALDLMVAERFDAVLMDWRLPGLSGLEAIAQWRDHEAVHDISPPLPIVSVTANAVSGDRDECLAAGATDFLAKPVSLSALDACLRSVLRRERAIRSGDFDGSSLRSLVGDLGLEVTLTLVSTFTTHLSQQRRELQQAAWRGDAELVGRIAHTIRPNAQLLGARGLAEICERLESATLQEGPSAELPIDRFLAAVDHVIDALPPEADALVREHS